MSESLTDRLAAFNASIELDALSPRIEALLRQVHQDPSLCFLDEFNTDPQDVFEQEKQVALEVFFVQLSEPLLGILRESFTKKDSYIRAFDVLFKLYAVALSYNASSAIIKILDQDLGVLIKHQIDSE